MAHPSETTSSEWFRESSSTAVQLSETVMPSTPLMSAAEMYGAGAWLSSHPSAVSPGRVPVITGAMVS